MHRVRPLLGILLAVGCTPDVQPTDSVAEATARAPVPSVSTSTASQVAWPALPQDEAAARAVIELRTRRSAAAEAPLTAASIDAALLEAAQRGEIAGGWDGAAFMLERRFEAAGKAGRRSFVLFGTLHDSAPQIVAFRRLCGALGAGVTDAVIEQFHADGRWVGVEPGMQRGDSSAIEQLQRDGDRRALDAVIAAGRDHGYAAWKYDYLEEMPALVATLRSSGVVLHACDMPAALQARARAAGDDALARLRELHCLLALEDRLHPGSAPSRVAMLWGAEHVGPAAVQRFLPPDAEITEIHVQGGRPAGATGLDREVALRVHTSAPLLFPVAGKDRFVLLLEEPSAPVDVDRARTDLGAEDVDRRGKLEVTAQRAIELWVAGQSLRVGPKPSAVPLAPGSNAFILGPKKGRKMAGSLTMPEHGFVELHVDPDASSLRLVVHGR